MTMDCLEFRRVAGADPRHLEAAAEAHARDCPRCAAHLRRLRQFDERILKALQVSIPRSLAEPAAATPPVVGLDRRRWLALAASIVGGVLVGTLLWVGGPQDTLAHDLMAHLQHEPQALVATGRPEEAAVLEAVLHRGGIRLRPGIGTVSYANSCPFRRHVVPHLVVQTDAGAVTVMALRHESTDAPVRFSEQGYSGTIVPAGPGSIAVIGAPDSDLEGVVARVLAALEWVEE